MGTHNGALLGAIGLCRKAGKLIIGTDAVGVSLREKKKPCGVLVAADVSENTAKRLADKCATYETPLVTIPASGGELAAAIGKSAKTAAVAVTTALATAAASAAVAFLLHATVRRSLPALWGRRAIASERLYQLLEKSKCHSAFLQSVNAQGRGKRNFHGGSLQASPAARKRAAGRRVPN